MRQRLVAGVIPPPPHQLVAELADEMQAGRRREVAGSRSQRTRRKGGETNGGDEARVPTGADGSSTAPLRPCSGPNEG